MGVEELYDSLLLFADHLISFKWLMVLSLAIVIAFLSNKIIEKVIPAAVKFVADRADNAADNEKLLRWRRLETFLSTILAATKLVVFFLSIYIAWQIISPNRPPVALVGASAVFIVLAGASIGPLIKDITYGVIMIAERWYNVGDHIVVDPFWKLGGIVEQVTLRSTKLRSLNGEIIWLHNQHIQAVRVTPRGVRNLAIDIFVSDVERGKALLNKTLKSLPIGPTTVVKEFTITETEKIGDELWRITATGQTAPGREWLIEDFAIESVKNHDERSKKGKVIVQGPIARFDDDAAARRFKRSVRAKSAVTKR